MTTGGEPQAIRVFVSSTFRDMQAERDHLVKFTFPQLRKLCEQRGVTWGEVDLRWGITDEQKAEGKVLPICLDEIKHCRPFFIGLLGERYGWIPDEMPAELTAREPWLAQFAGRSVTELEILHGVLNNPEMARHAFFYFRDPACLNALPQEQRSGFQEEVSPAEIARLGREGAEAEVKARREKLAALKQRIRGSGFPTRENYQDSRQLGEWILHDLSEVIERLFPKGSRPDPLAREAAEHEAFAANRARVYIGRQAYFDRLDAHAASLEPPLVLRGESGSGKSALLANWAARYAGAHPDEFLLMHFTGATPDSTDWTALLARIMGELKRRFHFQDEIPTRPESMKPAFKDMLERAAAQGRMMLVLDAVNQLEDRDQALELAWLPAELPDNLRLFISTLPGRSQEELERRGWPTLEVEPLAPDERRELIRAYLSLFTKALEKSQVEQVASRAAVRQSALSPRSPG